MEIFFPVILNEEFISTYGNVQCISKVLSWKRFHVYYMYLVACLTCLIKSTVTFHDFIFSEGSELFFASISVVPSEKEKLWSVLPIFFSFTSNNINAFFKNILTINLSIKLRHVSDSNFRRSISKKRIWLFRHLSITFYYFLSFI